MNGPANRDSAPASDAKTIAGMTILWNFYQDHLTQARHHETLRGGITAAVILASGAILAALGNSTTAELFNQKILSLLIWGTALIVLGAFGYLASIKHFQLFCRQLEISYSYRDAISALYAGRDIGSGYYTGLSATCPVGSKSRCSEEDWFKAALAPLTNRETGLHLHALRERGEEYHNKNWESYAPGTFSELRAKQIRKLPLYRVTNSIHLAIVLIGMVLVGASITVILLVHL